MQITRNNPETNVERKDVMDIQTMSFLVFVVVFSVGAKFESGVQNATQTWCQVRVHNQSSATHSHILLMLAES